MSRYSDLLATQGVTQHWEMNEASGDAIAATGGVDAVATGTPIYSEPAVVNTGIKLTNNSSSFSTASTSAANFTSSEPYSYSFIMYLHSNASTPQGLFSKRIAASNAVHFACFVFTGGVLTCDLGANQARWSTGWTPLVDTWYHVAFTYDPSDSNRYRLYVNGEQFASSTAFSPTTQASSAPIHLGVLGGSTTAVARATLDEIAIFDNKLLSAAEVLAQYATAFPIMRVFNGSVWTDADRRIIA